MRIEDFIRRADQLIAQADAVLATTQRSEMIGQYVDSAASAGFRSAALSFLRSTFGIEHPFYTEFEKHAGSDPWGTGASKAVLTAARDEMAGGWTATVRGLIAAELFSDFLEMARHLLDEGYKDAAAVMIGSVLEEHIRQLCIRHGMDLEAIKPNGDKTPKKADVMNADLTKAGVYNGLTQKNVTAWLDLRNKAAHGKYGEYTKEQVEFMYMAVADFMARVPAT